jgi:hypothetical protein
LEINMASMHDGPLLKTTRGLINGILTGVAVAGVALALGSAALPIWWSDVVAIIMRERPGTDTIGLLPWLLMLFAGCILVLGLIWTALRRLLEIVRTVGEGQAFITANATRLRTIGWMLLAIEIIGMPIASIARNVADRFGDNDVGYSISLAGLLAILFAFVLARVFEQGVALREDMEGTV